MAGLVLLAPHVVVEDITVEAIRETRHQFEEGELRERMARHHDNPDAVFRGWCDVWLDPAFRDWSLEAEAAAVTAPRKPGRVSGPSSGHVRVDSGRRRWQTRFESESWERP